MFRSVVLPPPDGPRSMTNSPLRNHKYGAKKTRKLRNVGWHISICIVKPEIIKYYIPSNGIKFIAWIHMDVPQRFYGVLTALQGILYKIQVILSMSIIFSYWRHKIESGRRKPKRHEIEELFKSMQNGLKMCPIKYP
jgi:hypothetical protein